MDRRTATGEGSVGVVALTHARVIPMETLNRQTVRTLVTWLTTSVMKARAAIPRITPRIKKPLKRVTWSSLNVYRNCQTTRGSGRILQEREPKEIANDIAMRQGGISND